MKRLISLFISVIVLLNTSIGVFAFEPCMEAVGRQLYETVENPTLGSIGGDWAVFGLARSEIQVPEGYFERYYKSVEEYVKNCGGVLSNNKYTEYSRVAITLTAIGKNPENVSGFNLFMPLADYEKTVKQGINGAIWALIALDCGNYEIPENAEAKVKATREMYVDHILNKQNPDGGWALSGKISDPDITGMALSALARYTDDENVKEASEKALLCMSEMQDENGGFNSCESSAQMIVALCELGISIDDERFIKNGKSLLDNMLMYYDGKGGFKHTLSGEVNQMATEQGFYALAALWRAENGKRSLYDMASSAFSDIKGRAEQEKIEALYERGIISGKSENKFEPQSTMTRAEFSTIIVNALELNDSCDSAFYDVTPDDWFYDSVNIAYACGIISGVSNTEFNPNGTITREQACAMIKRAAALFGENTKTDLSCLSGFSDYAEISDWSKEDVAYCINAGIVSRNNTIKPREAVTRAEIAVMIYNLTELLGE